MNEPKCKVSDICRRVSEESNEDLQHLDVLNAIKLIKGDKEIDKKSLLKDLRQIMDLNESTYVVMNNSIPCVIFIQTKEMKEKYSKYPEVVLVSVSKKRKNKHGLYIVHLTGIDTLGHAITFGMGFLDIK